MSHIRRDDRRSVRYTGSSEVTCDLAPVRPSDVTSRPVVRRSGPGGLGALPPRGSHRPVLARIRAYGSSDHGFAALR